MSTDQLDLFGATPATPPAGREQPPAKTRGARASATPAVARDVLAEIADGRYGLLDDTDHAVVFEDTDRVRHALDDDTIAHLVGQGYAERCPARETVSAHHGAIRRPVSPLRLTKRGRTLLARWSALQPLAQKGK